MSNPYITNTSNNTLTNDPNVFSDNFVIKDYYDLDHIKSNHFHKRNQFNNNYHCNPDYPKPYINLIDRLSQLWLNKYTLFLILMAIKIFLFQKAILSSLSTAELFTQQSCQWMENTATTLASLPHYMGKTANTLLLKGINEINDAIISSTKLLLSATENIIIFVISLLVGTYACLLTTAVDTSIDIATNISATVIDFVNDTIIDAADGINDSLEDLSSVMNKIADAGESIIDLLTGNNDAQDGADSINNISLKISSLENIKIPSSVDDALSELADIVPDFDTLKNKTETAIKIPFEYLKSQLSNKTVFDSSGDTLTVPELKKVQFCSGSTEIEDFYNDLSSSIEKTSKIIFILLIIFAVLILIPLAYQEILGWKRIQRMTSEISSLNERRLDELTMKRNIYEVINNNYNTVPVVFSNLVNYMLFKLFNISEKTQLKIKWMIMYITSQRAFFIFMLGITGIITVIFQYIILSVLKSGINGLTDIFKDLISAMTSEINNSAIEWTSSTNTYLTQREDSINENLFGVVHDATGSVNDIIFNFLDDMNERLADIFNDTFFYKPVQAIVGCMIEDKLIAISKGLTWVYNNTEVSFSRVNETYLTDVILYNDTSSSASSLLKRSTNDFSVTTLVEGSENSIKKVLRSLFRQYKKATNTELYISIALISIWLFQLVAGLILLVIKKQFKLNDKHDFELPETYYKADED
ncbi:pheromone-regulated protein PRM1 ASCRUDRAFT_76670 [Ascoidea rubescens DSM 1968]|uniref:Plasma membrane fusion protein PRM1 n=1 Tax=Ascoidea rubescens DSM 1968 TaxID=1344418 RepID=A0A1D2VEP2_9ASCO|nr:hypothetical protein ASCRUDRAFT_76670 [Ascoidea rubescens DSM 1968]ODV60168.1 hypothetical protein ASCRUDRAFT_76670 [Ascoidea rubescens DSM 1968]